MIGPGGSPVMHTPIGGIAIQKINKTGAPSIKGTVIEVDDSQDFSIKLTEADTDDATGIIYNSGIPDGGLVWVVIDGAADALLEDSSACLHGNWARTSITQAGRVDATNLGPPAGGLILELEQHFKEVGHCEQSVTAGTDKLARINIHLN